MGGRLLKIDCSSPLSPHPTHIPSLSIPPPIPSPTPCMHPCTPHAPCHLCSAPTGCHGDRLQRQANKTIFVVRVRVPTVPPPSSAAWLLVVLYSASSATSETHCPTRCSPTSTTSPEVDSKLSAGPRPPSFMSYFVLRPSLLCLPPVSTSLSLTSCRYLAGRRHTVLSTSSSTL